MNIELDQLNKKLIIDGLSYTPKEAIQQLKEYENKGIASPILWWVIGGFIELYPDNKIFN